MEAHDVAGRGCGGTWHGADAHETPFTPDDPADYEYPFPDATNAALYALYRQRADALPGVLVCGRLGEYRYYDMDQAILRAQSLALKLLADASDALPA